MKSSETLRIAVLLIGVALLTTTFIDAYLLLKEDVNILPVPNLVAAFGEALAPLIEASIQMMYLGVMVWVGSTVTMRGITLLLQVKPEAERKPKRPKKIETEAKPKTPKETKKKAEPEPKSIDEVWEKAFQEATLEVKA